MCSYKEEKPVKINKLIAFDPNNIDNKKEIENHCFSESYITGLINLIKDKIAPPFSLSIDGDWGTGKTHLLKIIERKLKNENYPTIWFNPWEYEKTDSAYIAFLKKISMSFKNEFKIATKNLGVFGLTLSISCVDSIARFISNNSISYLYTKDILKDVLTVTGSNIDNYEDIIKELKSDFVKITKKIAKENEFSGKPIIIFLDDLDRCLPKNALELLEALKNTFNVKDANAIFICGQNSNITKKFIVSTYSSIDDYASNYFKKIFDYSIKIPIIPKERIKDFINFRLSEIFKSSDTELVDIIQKLNAEIDNKSLRVIEKIIYGYFFYDSIVETKKMDIEFVIFWLFFKEKWPEAYDILLIDIMKNANKTVGCVQKFIESNKEMSDKTKEFLSNHINKHNEIKLVLLIEDNLL